jgi:hypothetical protein
MQGKGWRQGRAAVTATALGVAIAAASAGASSAVTVPDLPVQPPEVPPLPTVPELPSAPAPTVPEVTTPEAPSVPRLSPQSSPRSDSGPAPSGSAPAPSAGGGVTGGSAAGGGSAGAPANTPGAGAAAAARESSPGARIRVRRFRKERRFQRSARRLEPCLFALSGFERRVIVLRAGFGGRRPLGRRRVAHRLGASVSRVRRAERGALRALGTARRTHGCLDGSGTGSGAQVLAAVAAPEENGGAPPLIPSTGSGAVRLASASSSQEPVLASMPGMPGLKAAKPGAGSLPPELSGPQSAELRPAAATSAGPSFGLVLALVALALLAIAASTTVLARHRTGAAAPAEAAPVPPAPIEEPTPAPAEPPPARRLSPLTAIGVAVSAISVAVGLLLSRRRH